MVLLVRVVGNGLSLLRALQSQRCSRVIRMRVLMLLLKVVLLIGLLFVLFLLAMRALLELLALLLLCLSLHARAATTHGAGTLELLCDLGRHTRLLLCLGRTLEIVGLARTLAATGDRDGARREYQAFLELWKEADPDLALLRDVKAELAKLES